MRAMQSSSIAEQSRPLEYELVLVVVHVLDWCAKVCLISQLRVKYVSSFQTLSHGGDPVSYRRGRRGWYFSLGSFLQTKPSVLF
jgi:hypothetical protein